MLNHLIAPKLGRVAPNSIGLPGICTRVEIDLVLHYYDAQEKKEQWIRSSHGKDSATEFAAI